MSCQDCNQSSISLTGSWFAGSPCVSTDCEGASTNALCVVYNGPNLPCSGVDALDNLETALQKIDAQICSISGDYSSYTMNCLPTWWGVAITTQAGFVDAITAYACDIDGRLTTFINTTYAANQTTLDGRLDALEVPGITCASASVVNTDTLNQILTKYCTKFTSLTAAIDISSVDWNNCLTVVSTPTTIAAGFQLLADQICTVYDLINAGGILPTFNNYGSCIGGTSSDSLVTTIGLIKTYLCSLSGTYVVWEDLVWGCTDNLVVIQPDNLQDALQNIITDLGGVMQKSPTFDGGDFTVTPNDVGNPCAGVTVSLATPLNVDRFVAVSAGDTSPGTLLAKLESTGGSIDIANDADTYLDLNIADQDYGDITVTSNGSVWTIDNDVVTYAKIQNMTTNKLLGRSTGGSGNIEEISIGSGLLLSGGTLSATGSTVSSGTYTPGLTNTTNITSSTSYSTYWYQVGDMVTVFGGVQLATTGAGATTLTMALPVTSGLTGGIRDLGGTAADPVLSAEAVSIQGLGGAAFKWVAAGAATYNLQFQFSYYITAP